MPTSPSTQFATLRPDLRDTLMEFDLAGDQAGFVGLKIAPVLEVQKPAGEFGRIELKEMLKSRSTKRAIDGTYAQGGGKGTKDSFSTDEEGLEERVDDREAETYGDWWDAEQLAAARCFDAVLRGHNDRVIQKALGISNTSAASAAWTDTANAEPIDDVRTAKLAVRDRVGIVPNVMVIDYDRFEFLKDCGQIVERIKYSGRDDPKRRSITLDALASVFDLDEVIVSGSVKNTANEAQAAALASMWDKTKALLFRRERGMDLKRPQFMRTFHWGADGSQIGGVIEDYRDESRRSDIIRVRMQVQEKVIYADVAEVITGI